MIKFKSVKDEISSIQILRAFAIFLVVLHHYNQAFFGWDMHYSMFGYHFGLFVQHDVLFALDLFFLISGFVIFIVLTKNNDGWRFIKRRFAKLIPTYWFYTLLMLVMIELVPELITSEWNFQSLMASFFFINHENPSSALGALPLLPVGWTLNLDVAFYLICALGILLLKKYWFVPVILLLLASNMIWKSEFMSYFFNSKFLVDLGIGMALGVIYIRGYMPESNTLAIVLLMLALSIIILLGVSDLKVLVGVLIFIGLIVTEENIYNNRFFCYLKKIGDWSYSTYLVHAAFVIPVATMIFSRQAPYQNEFLLFSFYILTTYLLSYLSYKYIENNKLTRYLYRL